ncbi:hypothetical protein JZ751_005651 [Albula glossodonta]|uniref:Uncharacterized protein n=1 Tax=Albula glossodonta TaxID=121402 RepID=A0A8T2MQ97_9TELE|nr:hypothetical protein JZ751_005651 [Albula glossodonta]
MCTAGLVSPSAGCYVYCRFGVSLCWLIFILQVSCLPLLAVMCTAGLMSPSAG